MAKDKSTTPAQEAWNDYIEAKDAAWKVYEKAEKAARADYEKALKEIEKKGE